MIDPNADTKRRLILSRVILAAVAVLAAYVAGTLGADILFLVSWAFSIAASGLFAALVLGIWWKKGGDLAGILAMLVGFVVCMFFLIMTEFYGPMLKSWLGDAMTIVNIRGRQVAYPWGINNISVGIFGIPASFLAGWIGGKIGAEATPQMQDFIDSIRFARPASALGQKCGMDRSSNLAVDLKGNVLTCQNVSAAAVAPNGQRHLIGQISDLDAVQMKSATHWSQRQGCSACPVLQLCKGSCMFLEGQLWEAGCDVAYSDNLIFFAAAIELLTGCMPIFIDGDLPPERKDIFGLAKRTVVSPCSKRAIPIVAAPQAA